MPRDTSNQSGPFVSNCCALNVYRCRHRSMAIENFPSFSFLLLRLLHRCINRATHLINTSRQEDDSKYGTFIRLSPVSSLALQWRIRLLTWLCRTRATIHHLVLYLSPFSAYRSMSAIFRVFTPPAQSPSPTCSCACQPTNYSLFRVSVARAPTIPSGSHDL